MDLVDRDAASISIVEAKEWRNDAMAQIEKRERESLIKQQQAVIAWLETTASSQENELNTQLDYCHANTCNWMTGNSKMKAWMGRGSGKKLLFFVRWLRLTRT